MWHQRCRLTAPLANRETETRCVQVNSEQQKTRVPTLHAVREGVAKQAGGKIFGARCAVCGMPLMWVEKAMANSQMIVAEEKKMWRLHQLLSFGTSNSNWRVAVGLLVANFLHNKVVYWCAENDDRLLLMPLYSAMSNSFTIGHWACCSYKTYNRLIKLANLANKDAEMHIQCDLNFLDFNLWWYSTGTPDFRHCILLRHTLPDDTQTCTVLSCIFSTT